MKSPRILVAALLASLACSGASRGGTAGFGLVDGGSDDTGTAAAPGDAGTVTPTDDGASPLVAFEGGTGSSTCDAGQYVGTYMGTDDGLPVSGPIALTLVAATMNGEDFLTVNDGSFVLSWGGTSGDASAGLIVVNATLTGNLDCADGDFSASDPSAPWTTAGLPSGTAVVDFTGTYDASTQTISGNFTIMSALSTSMGTWSVTRQ